MDYHIIIIRVTLRNKQLKLKKGGITLKLFANIFASLGTLIANMGTFACSPLICDEPKMPKSLLNK